MFNERKAPLLCLKLGVPSALCRGKKVSLGNAPFTSDGEFFVPSEALAMAGIDAKDEFTSVSALDGLYTVYEGMGLLFLDDESSDTLSLDNDLVYILSLAHKFIFEIEVGKLGSAYAPATDDEREGFKRVGAQLLELFRKRNNTHPYLFGSQDIFDKLRAIYTSDEDSVVKAQIKELVERADSLLKEHVPDLNENGDGLVEPMVASGYGETEYDVGGRHSNSEAHLTNLTHPAFAYLMTGEERFAKHVYYAVLGIIGRLHWGPGHFLNCSGGTMRLAIIYDWLATAWEKMGLDAGKIRRGIYTHGLHHGYNSVINDTCDFPSPQQGTGWRFKLKNDNWNSVCNDGMIVGTLAILADGADEYISNEEYDKAVELLGACITSTMQPQLVFTQYAPDGSYVESNSYWAYGTNNLVISMAALYDSLGTDLGLHNACGFDKTCYYAINAESAEFIGWNYHDGSLGSQNTSCFNPLATISGDSQLYAIRNIQIKGGKEVNLFDMLYHPDVRGGDMPELSDLPLDYAMTGIDAFTVRNGWERGSLYAGMIGGENPSGASHNQIDSGAFVYHNFGKLWFTDLGSDYYNSVGKNNGTGYFANYSLYRRNAEGNNCLILKSLEFGQLLGGRGVMTEYSSSDTASYSLIDNASVYGEDKVKTAKRGMLLTNGRRTLVIKDEVELVSEDTAYFTAHFESDHVSAELLDGGKKCVLTHKDGEKIYVSVVGDGTLTLMNCEDALLLGTYPAEGEYSRENFSRLVIKHENVRSINSAFVISEEEDHGYTDLGVDMWKTL